MTRDLRGAITQRFDAVPTGTVPTGTVPAWVDPTAVDVAWQPSQPGDDLLREHLVRVHGPAATVRTGRLCPQCGSGTHGRPWARVGDRPALVSLARSGPHLLTAIATAEVVTGLGVDVESVGDLARRWSPEVVLAPGEVAETDEQRCWLWCAKEAIAKSLGTGLALGPDRIVVAEHHVVRLAAPEGYLAALAVR